MALFLPTLASKKVPSELDEILPDFFWKVIRATCWTLQTKWSKKIKILEFLDTYN